MIIDFRNILFQPSNISNDRRVEAASSTIDSTSDDAFHAVLEQCSAKFPDTAPEHPSDDHVPDLRPGHSQQADLVVAEALRLPPAVYHFKVAPRESHSQRN